MLPFEILVLLLKLFYACGLLAVQLLYFAMGTRVFERASPFLGLGCSWYCIIVLVVLSFSSFVLGSIWCIDWLGLFVTFLLIGSLLCSLLRAGFLALFLLLLLDLLVLDTCQYVMYSW